MSTQARHNLSGPALGGGRIGANDSGARFSQSRNPAYQIDFTAAMSGKRVAQTKRRVRWRFGFSNADALAAGQKGVDCRGEEHDVTLIWSLTSGKRLILADGQEVHFSTGRRTEGKFQCSWTMRGNHVLKIIAHAAPPLQAKPGWKQFDLLLDGMSFAEMPKIYELGVKAGGSDMVPHAGPAQVSSPRQPYSNYSMPREEEMQWAHNVEEAEERRNIDRGMSQDASLPGPTPETPPAVSQSFSMPSDLVSDQIGAQDLVSPSPAVLDQIPPPPPPQVQQRDEFAPAPRDVHSEILGAYQEPPQQTAAPPSQALVPAAPSVPGQYQLPPSPPQQRPQAPQPVPVTPPYYGQPQPQQQAPQYYEQQYQQQPPAPQFHEQPAPPTVSPEQQQFQPVQEASEQQFYASYSQQMPEEQPAPVAPDSAEPAEAGGQLTVVPKQSMYGAPVYVEDVDEEEENADEVQKAMRKLVNLENIAEPSRKDEPVAKNPFEQAETVVTDKEGKIRSRGIPPKAPHWTTGAQPALGEIQATSGPKVPPSKEVMKPGAFDPSASAAGMMVVYGAAQGGPPGGVAPPLQRVSGFGVGAQMHQGGYTHVEPVMPGPAYQAQPQYPPQAQHPQAQVYAAS